MLLINELTTKVTKNTKRNRENYRIIPGFPNIFVNFVFFVV